MSDIHALSGAYAIDALDDVERARFSRHLVDCPDCQVEIESLREAAAMLPETTVLAAPASLRASVLEGIETVRPRPPVVDVTVTRPRRRIAGLVAVAAALVAIGGVGATVWHPWSDESSESPGDDLTASDVLAAADARSWTQELPDGSRLKVTRSESLNGAVVQASDLAPAGEGKVYQVWLQHDDVMVSAGLMPDDSDATVLLDGDAASADGVGITREPAGGSREPTRPPVALVGFTEA